MSGLGRASVVTALCGLWLPAVAAYGAAGAPPAASALEHIDACRRSLVPEVDMGYERIVQKCPDLLRTLGDTQLALWLPSGWTRAGDNLTAQGLTELSELLSDELARSARRVTPSLQSLPGILKSLHTDSPPTGWWARFRAWLRRALQDGESGTEATLWLHKLHVSPAALATTIVGAAVLFLLLAVVLLTNELRAAGLLRRRRRAGVITPPLTEGAAAALSDESIDRLPMIERPAALLRLAALRLSASRPTPGAALTARELQRALERESPIAHADAGEVLGRVVDVAELIRYGERLPPEPAIAAIVARGRAVLGEAA